MITPGTTFETTFEVRATPEQAWKVLDDAQAGRVDGTGEPRRWWLPGFEGTGVEIECEPGRHLTVRKESMPCVDTTIAITFEHLASGTRITVVQSGFDEAFVDAAGDAFWTHADEIAIGFRSYFTEALART
jgi:hypothetical protein